MVAVIVVDLPWSDAKSSDKKLKEVEGVGGKGVGEGGVVAEFHK